MVFSLYFLEMEMKSCSSEFESFSDMESLSGRYLPGSLDIFYESSIIYIIMCSCYLLEDRGWIHKLADMFS